MRFSKSFAVFVNNGVKYWHRSEVFNGPLHFKDHAPSPLGLTTMRGGVVIEGAWSSGGVVIEGAWPSRGRGHRGGVAI